MHSQDTMIGPETGYQLERRSLIDLSGGLIYSALSNNIFYFIPH